jgi:putative flippase GtrA
VEGTPVPGSNAKSRRALGLPWTNLRFVRFVLLGGLAAVVNFGSRFVFSLAMPFEAAVICAYLLAAATGFILFRLFVFPGRARPLSQQSIVFLVVSAGGMALTWVVSVTLLRFVFPAIGFGGPREAIAHAIGLIVPIISSYFGHRRFTFGG